MGERVIFPPLPRASVSECGSEVGVCVSADGLLFIVRVRSNGERLLTANRGEREICRKKHLFVKDHNLFN